jgi:hypothetical protein
MLHFQEGRLDLALADLHAALDHGADPGTVHYDLALVHAAGGDAARALHHARQALERRPTHRQARELHDALQLRVAGPDGQS